MYSAIWQSKFGTIWVKGAYLKDICLQFNCTIKEYISDTLIYIYIYICMVIYSNIKRMSAHQFGASV